MTSEPPARKLLEELKAEGEIDEGDESLKPRPRNRERKREKDGKK